MSIKFSKNGMDCLISQGCQQLDTAHTENYWNVIINQSIYKIWVLLNHVERHSSEFCSKCKNIFIPSNRPELFDWLIGLYVTHIRVCCQIRCPLHCYSHSVWKVVQIDEKLTSCVGWVFKILISDKIVERKKLSQPQEAWVISHCLSVYLHEYNLVSGFLFFYL